MLGAPRGNTDRVYLAHAIYVNVTKCLFSPVLAGSALKQVGGRCILNMGEGQGAALKK